MNYVFKMIKKKNYYYYNNKMKKNQSERGRGRRKEEDGRERIFFFYFFLIFASFSDLQKLDRRFSPGLKAKLIYAMRTTCGHQNLGVSSNSTR